ncbi:MAG: hypothetical protein ACTSQJ_12790, partial [Promethearchaeota archaeon]
FTETREEEEQAEIIPEEEEIVEELQKIIEEGETREQLPDYTVEQLIEEANQLVEIEEFDEALERYNEGLKIYISLNDVNKIEEVKSLIEKCEIAKSEFLQKVPKEKVISDVIKQEEEILREKEIQEQRVKEFEERKKKEKQISEQAYDFMEQGSEFIKNKQFTEGIEFYEKAVNLFSEINWVNDVQKINAIISKLRKEKEIFEKEIEKDKEKKLEEFRKKVEHEALLREKKEEQKRQEEIARLEKIKEYEIKKIEEETFKKSITEMVDRAEKLEREYTASIKKGKFEIECPYEEIIDIYTEIRKKLLEKEWKEQAFIYANQIKIYKEKLERDKKLREIEAQKALKEKEYEELLKSKRVQAGSEVERLKILEEQSKIAEEEEKFLNKIEEMENKAEKMAREYEIAIKKGKFEKECPYLEIIKIYKEIRQLLLDRNKKDMAGLYLNQINVYKGKLERDKKLREIEAQKALKEKEYEELLKIKKEEHIQKVEIAQEVSPEEIEGDNFRDEIGKMEKRAEVMAREYEVALRKGQFELKCPYPEIIEIYENIYRILSEREQKSEAAIYLNQINVYKEKLKRDKRLREIEAQKIEKQKIYDDLYKIEKKSEKTRIEILEEQAKLAEVEEEFQNKISLMEQKAERMAREYEVAIRRGKFEMKCPYEEIIEIYEEIKQILTDNNRKDEAALYLSQIRAYREKLEKDQKLREFEAEKAKKQKEFENKFKIKKISSAKEGILPSIKEEKTKEIEEKKKIEEYLSNKAMELIEQAEKLVKDYNLKIKKGILKIESPYEKVIFLYKKARKFFQEIQWKKEAVQLISTIKYYKDKKEKDDKLRELERLKLEKRKKDESEIVPVWKKSTIEREKKLLELETKKKSEEERVNQIFSKINNAEKIVKEYEQSIKGGNILDIEAPYIKILEVYREAKKELENLGWKDEAKRLVNSIKFYKDKKEKDDKLREIERKKQEKDRIYKESLKFGVEKPSIKREAKIQELQEKKKKDENASDEAFEMVENAEKIAQEYEKKIKSGTFPPESPYQEIIEIVREAKKKLENIGWKDEASKLINTIKHYRKKKEKDDKLRELEAKKMLQEQEMLKVQKQYAEKLKEKKKGLLSEKEKELTQKQKKFAEQELLKNKAFDLMDKAKIKFNKRSYNEAIELYQKSEEIFKEINWQEGIQMIKSSIAMINKKKKEFEKRQELLKQKEKEKLKIEKKLEKKFAKIKDLKKIEEAKKKLELQKIQLEKQKEKEFSDKAYRYLEEGTALLERKKFDEAFEKYIQARNIFKQLNWAHEVSRINNDLLFKLKREKKKFESLEALKKKKLAEKKVRDELFKQAQLKDTDITKIKKEKERKKLKALELSKAIDKKIRIGIDDLNEFINKGYYNQGILKLKELILNLKKKGLKDEIEKINQQINEIKNEAQIPLIVLEDLDKSENLEKFKTSYTTLDRAQESIINGNFMKAISELNEAKYNLKDTIIGSKFIEEVNNKIAFCRELLQKKKKQKLEREPEEIEVVIEEKEISGDLAYKYMDLCNKEERRNNFEKAIQYANKAKEIFTKLGPEWSREQSTITQYILTLKKKQESRLRLFKLAQQQKERKKLAFKAEEEEFKERIAARRAERRKKIQELIRKKK